MFRGEKAGETIRQAAERTAGEILVKSATTPGHPDDVAQLYFVGNCPAGWFWRAPGKEESEPKTYYGEKVITLAIARWSKLVTE